jgi:hypothetical protein
MGQGLLGKMYLEGTEAAGPNTSGQEKGSGAKCVSTGQGNLDQIHLDWTEVHELIT